ncbi:DUF302 domain-containing protein [Oxyplasma meridianum]|uniref:DUF302 domain-containing protein n=1 Tax=Oxyplasma meridianum TaxID=3073602 RepID=A0AAX4NFE1_9ARCH
MNTYSFEMELNEDVEEVYGKIFKALKGNSWILLSYVDAKQIIENNFHENFPPYYILNVCKPIAAKELLTENMDFGLFLPCKVIVYKTEKGTKISVLRVSAMDREHLGGKGTIAEKYENDLIALIKGIKN